MTTREKFVRKELRQPDEFVTGAEQFLDFCRKNALAMAAAAGGVVLLWAVFWGVSYNKEVQELRMETLLHEMQKTLLQAGKRQPDEIVAELKKMLEQFSGGNHLQRGRLLLADAYYKAGKFKESIDVYNEVVRGTETGGLLHALSMSGLGYAYESNREYDKAIETYKAIIDKEKSYPLFNVYDALARSYELKKDTSNALQILRTMQNEFKEGPGVERVAEKIRKLEKTG